MNEKGEKTEQRVVAAVTCLIARTPPATTRGETSNASHAGRRGRVCSEGREGEGREGRAVGVRRRCSVVTRERRKARARCEGARWNDRAGGQATRGTHELVERERERGEDIKQKKKRK